MPTAVEFGERYTQQILRDRGIPESAVKAAIARGHGTGIAEGKRLHRHTFHGAGGSAWVLQAIARGGQVLSGWIEPDRGAAPRVVPRPPSGGQRSLPAVQLQMFSDGERQYHALSRKPVAVSHRFEDLAIADYDCDGSVRGLEFLGRMHGTLEFHLRKASLATQGFHLRSLDAQTNGILIGLLRSLNIGGVSVGAFPGQHGLLLPAV